MGIRTTARKTYQIAANTEDPASASPPEVGLNFQEYANNLNKFNNLLLKKI